MNTDVNKFKKNIRVSCGECKSDLSVNTEEIDFDEYQHDDGITHSSYYDIFCPTCNKYITVGLDIHPTGVMETRGSGYYNSVVSDSILHEVVNDRTIEQWLDWTGCLSPSIIVPEESLQSVESFGEFVEYVENMVAMGKLTVTGLRYKWKI